MILRAAGVLLAVVLCVLVAITRGRYYIAYSFASPLLVWVATKPPRWRYAAIGAVAAVLWLIRINFAEVDPRPLESAGEQMFYMTAAFLGAASLIMLALLPPRRDGEVDILPVLAAFSVAAWGLFADRWFRYMTDNPLLSLDRHLFALDAHLGIEAVSFAAGRLFAAMPPFAFVAAIVYRMVPLLLALVFVTLPRTRARLNFIVAASAASVIGYVSYRLCPAAGPIYAFPELYPRELPVMAPGWLRPVDMPSSLLNAFPSLHTTWVLLALTWSQFVPRPVRAIVWVLGGLTLMATLGLGEHYVVDLIAAIPFFVAFELLLTPRPVPLVWRAIGVGVSAGIFAAWVAGVRSGTLLEMNQQAFRLFAAATLVAPLLLRGAARTAPPPPAR